MQVVPLQAAPRQTLQVQLGTQATRLDVYQTLFGLFVDVYVDNALIVGGVVAENLNRIVRDAYLGFAGDLAFVDTQGEADPIYTGLGSQFLLLYLEPSELREG